MRHAILILFLALCLPTGAVAKRAPAPKVEPVIHEGVKYTAPNDRGAVGYVVASEAATGAVLWKKTIYRVWLWPLEQDVQWVFIKQMRVEDGKLIVANERQKVYALDLKTRRVRKLK